MQNVIFTLYAFFGEEGGGKRVRIDILNTFIYDNQRKFQIYALLKHFLNFI